jgi:hypothetical protein
MNGQYGLPGENEWTGRRKDRGPSKRGTYAGVIVLLVFVIIAFSARSCGAAPHQSPPSSTTNPF